ncbi:MAG: ATP-binding protein [Bacteroidales bacterium]|nr:ATP-binding protein [Bacteroidales bacterium]
MPTFTPVSSKRNKPEQPTVDEVKSSLFGNDGEGQKGPNKFIEDDPKWRLEQIILNEKVRETILDVIIFCQNKDRLIKEWGLNNFLKGNSSIGINLYGEPGTGKTITAEAIAQALGKKIIRVDYSELQDSKWGQTEKNLSLLFKNAEENGSVIFLDEADGLLGKRTTNSSNSNTANEIKSHLLTLIDRSNVIIVYATNLFKNFDRAFFRRILYHVKYPRPNNEELVELWKFHLGDPKILERMNLSFIKEIPKNMDSFSYAEIAQHSVGLAGGDIKNITLKLCVKICAGKIAALSTIDVKNEIDTYRQSSEDSKGTGARIVPDSELTDEQRKALEEERKG